MLVTNVLLHGGVPVASRVLYGELPAGALGLVLAVVRAVAAGEEGGVGVDVDPALWQPHRAVLHVFGVTPVYRVDTGDGDVLLSVAQVL